MSAPTFSVFYLYSNVLKLFMVWSLLKIWICLSQNVDADEEEENWRKVSLTEHNILRAKHGVPILKEDAQLDKIAQKYAEYLAAKNLFDHSTDNEYGENLMQTSADNEVDAVRDAVDSWYEEIKDYDYKKPGYNETTSHFTTMLWKDSTHVGVGIAWNEKEEQYVVVANYKPGGNVDGEYQDNVFPAIK